MPIAPPSQPSQSNQPSQSKPPGKPGRDLRPKPGMSYWEYFQYLLSQGVNAIDASAIMEADPNYGTPDQWNKRQQELTDKGQQANAYGRLTGGVGAAILADYVFGDKTGKNSPVLAQALSNRTGDQVTWARKTPSGSTEFQGITPQGENVIGVSRKVPEATLDLDKIAAEQGQTGAGQAAQTSTTTQAASTQPQATGETTVVQTNAGPREMPVEAANDTEFVKGTDWNQVGNGALAALQAYQAYQAWKSGDKVGAGISGTTAGLSAGAAAYGSGSTAAAALPYAGGVSALYGGYQTAKLTGAMPKSKQRDVKATTGGAAAGAAGGAAIGSQIGSGYGPIGMAIGAGLGAVAGYAGSKFGSSKGKGQSLRDNIRYNLQQSGALDENYQGTLADGSKYDFGQDGSTMKWSEINKIADANRKAWDATSNMAGVFGLNSNLTGQKNADVAAWIQKAAVSNAGNDPAKAIANMRHLATEQGIDYTTVKSNLDTALADNKISKAQYDSYMQGARELWGEKIVAPGEKPAARMSTKEKEEDRKAALKAGGVDLDNISVNQAYELYKQGAISEEEYIHKIPGINI